MIDNYTHSMKILLLEDDTLLAESLQEYLTMEGFSVDTVSCGEDVFEMSYQHQYDLYILDINVPDINGLEVLKALKEADDPTPAIYISAMTDIQHITQGFDAGAVDYIKKPFDPEELLVRIKHHLGDQNESLTYGDTAYDPQTGKITLHGESLYLSHTQKSLFDQLIFNRGNIVPAEVLMESMEKPNANALRVAITKLKKKTGIDIKNIRGQGYTIEAL